MYFVIIEEKGETSNASKKICKYSLVKIKRNSKTSKTDSLQVENGLEYSDENELKILDENGNRLTIRQFIQDYITEKS
jgi:hypothetical protein